MDSFFATVPIRRKTRVHFHAFMRDVHDDRLRALKDEADPLATRRGAASRSATGSSASTNSTCPTSPTR